MPDLQHLLLFIAAGWLLNLTPGADTLYIVSRAAGGDVRERLLLRGQREHEGPDVRCRARDFLDHVAVDGRDQGGVAEVLGGLVVGRRGLVGPVGLGHLPGPGRGQGGVGVKACQLGMA